MYLSSTQIYNNIQIVNVCGIIFRANAIQLRCFCFPLLHIQLHRFQSFRIRGFEVSKQRRNSLTVSPPAVSFACLAGFRVFGMLPYVSCADSGSVWFLKVGKEKWKCLSTSQVSCLWNINSPPPIKFSPRSVMKLLACIKLKKTHLTTV